ncbi:hypothetical protein [Merdimonas faecis]|nr:hypothetical protein [Merdimonas faecis]
MTFPIRKKGVSAACSGQCLCGKCRKNISRMCGKPLPMLLVWMRQ